MVQGTDGHLDGIVLAQARTGARRRAGIPPRPRPAPPGTRTSGRPGARPAPEGPGGAAAPRARPGHCPRCLPSWRRVCACGCRASSRAARKACSVRDRAGLRAHQRGVVGPQRVAVQQRPQVVVETGPDTGAPEPVQGLFGEVAEGDRRRVVAFQRRLGPVRGSAAGGGNDERFLAGGLVLQPAAGCWQELAAAALGQLAHGVEEVQPHAADQDGFAGGDTVPVHVGRHGGRQVAQAQLLRGGLQVRAVRGSAGTGCAPGPAPRNPRGQAAPVARPTSNVPSRRGRTDRALSFVEFDGDAVGRLRQQVLEGAAQVPAVEGTAGEVVGPEHWPVRPVQPRSGTGAGCCCCRVTPLVEGGAGHGGGQRGVLGNQRGIEGLGVHQEQPGLLRLPDMARALPGRGPPRRCGAAAARLPAWPGGGVGEQPLQDAGAPGAGTDDGGPDALRFFHGIQRIALRAERLTCPPSSRCCLDGAHDHHSS